MTRAAVGGMAEAGAILGHRRATFLAAVLWPALLFTATPVSADALLEAVTGYIEFEPYDSGILLPEQITAEIWPELTFVDTRSAAQFSAATIPGARHIEWREVPGRLEELPQSGKVVLFCNTGSLSAQAAFAARLLGRDNVVVLQTGFLGWQEHGAFRPD